VNRIAIANYRILAVDADGVVFRYRDNRVKDPESPEAQKTMRLSGPEFIRRFLQHVLPPGFHQIRYYGLLGGSRRKANLTACRALLGLDQPEAPYIADLEGFLSKQAIDPSPLPELRQGPPTPSLPDPLFPRPTGRIRCRSLNASPAPH
jgi:hypothetical protein